MDPVTTIFCSIFVGAFALAFLGAAGKGGGHVVGWVVLIALVCAFWSDAHGFSFESDGDRALKEAQAEEIRLRAQAEYRRELALLESKGHHRPEDRDGVSSAAFLLAFAVAVASLLWAFVENKWRTARETELRELTLRLAIAQSAERPAVPSRALAAPERGRECV